MHAPSLDFENHRHAVSLSDCVGSRNVLRQMNMVTRTCVQAVLSDGFEKAGRGAVIENIGWLLFGISALYGRGRVALNGADSLAVVRNDKAFLVTGGDNLPNGREVQRRSMSGSPGNQTIDIGPAFIVEPQVDGLRFVAKYVTKKPADFVNSLSVCAHFLGDQLHLRCTVGGSRTGCSEIISRCWV